MCLAQSHTTVDEERVVDLAQPFGHRACGSVGQLVGSSDDEFPERVPRIQPRDRCGLGSRQRGQLQRHKWELVGIRPDLEHDFDVGKIEACKSLLDLRGVVTCQPVFEQLVRHLDCELPTLVRDESGRPEPGVERSLVYFACDESQDFRPDVFFFQLTPPYPNSQRTGYCVPTAKLHRCIKNVNGHKW